MRFLPVLDYFPLDRGLNIELEGIDEKDIKKFEKEIVPKINKIKSQVLSYIFDRVSNVLKLEAEGGIGLESRSRMADWEEYAEMISRSMGYEPMEFINAYRKNRQTKTQVIIDETPIAEALINLMVLERLEKIANGNGGGSWTQTLNKELIWTGSASQLLGVLKPIAEEDLKIDTNKTDLWPKAPNVLTRRLKLVENSLKRVGISITKNQNTKTKLKTLKIVKNTLEGVQVSTTSTISAVTSDMSVTI